jgi:hypothetical protein
MRVFAWIALAYGLRVFSTNIFNPEASWTMPVVVLPLAVVPLLATGLAFGGYVHHINVILPPSARRSKDALTRFAGKVPRDTVVEIKCMWLRPWPVTKSVYFGDLRRLPYNTIRLTNLEHIPLATRKEQEQRPIYSWMVRLVMGRYWVSRQQIKDRSRAPGVWDTMWRQIPMVGEEKSAEVKAAEKVPYAISNRPNTRAAAKAPPPVLPTSSKGPPPPPKTTKPPKR